MQLSPITDVANIPLPGQIANLSESLVISTEPWSATARFPPFPTINIILLLLKSFWALSHSLVSNTSFNNLSSGVYDIIVEDFNGCVFNSEQEILVNNPIDVSYTGEPYNCFGETNAFFNILIEGGTPPYTYQWIDPNFNVIEDESNDNLIEFDNLGTVISIVLQHSFSSSSYTYPGGQSSPENLLVKKWFILLNVRSGCQSWNEIHALDFGS